MVCLRRLKMRFRVFFLQGLAMPASRAGGCPAGETAPGWQKKGTKGPDGVRGCCGEESACR